MLSPINTFNLLIFYGETVRPTVCVALTQKPTLVGVVAVWFFNTNNTVDYKSTINLVNHNVVNFNFTFFRRLVSEDNVKGLKLIVKIVLLKIAVVFVLFTHGATLYYLESGKLVRKAIFAKVYVQRENKNSAQNKAQNQGQGIIQALDFTFFRLRFFMFRFDFFVFCANFYNP